MNGALMAPATPLVASRQPASLRRRAAAASAPPCAAFAALSLSSRSGAGAALRAAPVGRSAAARGALCVVAGSMEVGVGLQGHKAGMTSYFTPEGAQVPVTVIALLPGNIVTQARHLRSANPKPLDEALGSRPARRPLLALLGGCHQLRRAVSGCAVAPSRRSFGER